LTRILADVLHDVSFVLRERVVIRRGEPYGSAHGAAESSNAPALRSGAEGLLPGTEIARVADAMIEARFSPFLTVLL
jgi:hypothetical protein